MSLQKTKPENSTLPAWLEPLVGPLYLDFVAPMPLEEALRRIKAEEKTGFFHYRRIHVDLIPHDADTFGFKVKKSGGKYATTEARGLLKRWDKNTTQVTGEVNVAAYNYLFLPVIFVIMVFLVTLLPGQYWWFGTLFIASVGLSWYTMRRNRHEIARLIETALEAQIEDSPIRW